MLKVSISSALKKRHILVSMPDRHVGSVALTLCYV